MTHMNILHINQHTYHFHTTAKRLGMQQGHVSHLKHDTNDITWHINQRTYHFHTVSNNWQCTSVIFFLFFSFFSFFSFFLSYLCGETPIHDLGSKRLSQTVVRVVVKVDPLVSFLSCFLSFLLSFFLSFFLFFVGWRDPNWSLRTQEQSLTFDRLLEARSWQSIQTTNLYGQQWSPRFFLLGLMSATELRPVFKIICSFGEGKKSSFSHSGIENTKPCAVSGKIKRTGEKSGEGGKTAKA